MDATEPSSIDTDDEIGLRDIFNILWPAKYWIMLAGVLAGVVAVVVVMQLPDVYKSEAVLSPAADSKSVGLAGITGQLGSIASFAGLNLSGGSGVEKSVAAIETLKSRAFLTRFLREHDLKIPLMAAKGWNRDTQEWVIDPEIYDRHSKQWVRKVSPPQKPEPSELEVYEAFSKMLSVEQDKKTMIVKLSVESCSPELAKQWVQDLINDINSYIKTKDLDEAERSINYLVHEIETTSITQIQTVLYQMIEEQKKTVMLASVRSGYAFEVIDPPVVPELKMRPKRAMIVIVSVGGAVLLALVLVLLKNAVKVSQVPMLPVLSQT